MLCAACRRFPGRKDENWWLVVGDPSSNTLLAIKRQALQKKGRAKLDITAPSTPGTHHLTLYFMCDSYMGCDQVSNPVSVLPANAHPIMMSSSWHSQFKACKWQAAGHHIPLIVTSKYCVQCLQHLTAGCRSMNLTWRSPLLMGTAAEPRLWRKLDLLQFSSVMCTSCCLCTL